MTVQTKASGYACDWICNVSRDPFATYIQRKITEGGTLFKLSINYEMKKDDECINEISGNSSVNTNTNMTNAIKHTVIKMRPKNRLHLNRTT